MQSILTIKEIVSAVGSPAGICGAIPTFATLSGLGITITDRYDNVVFQEDDMSLNSHISSGTAKQGIIVNNNNVSIATAAYYNSNNLYINIAFDYVFDYTYLKISISKNGYFTYNNVIKVYGYDITTNNSKLTNSINITLIKEVYEDENNFLVQMSYSDFCYIRQPFTNLVEIYNTTSSPGNNNFIQPNLLYLNNIALDSSNEYELTLSTTVGKYTCNKTYLIPANMQWKPEVSHTVTCVDNCSSCINTISDNQIDILVTVNDDNFLYINNILDTAFKNFGIRAEVYNYNGQLIYTNGNGINITNYVNVGVYNWAHYNNSYLLSYNDITFSEGLNVVKVYFDVLGKLQNVVTGEVNVINSEYFAVPVAIESSIGTNMYSSGMYYYTKYSTVNPVNFGVTNSYRAIVVTDPSLLSLYKYYKVISFDTVGLTTTDPNEIIDEQLLINFTDQLVEGYHEAVIYNTKEEFYVEPTQAESLVEISPVVTCEYTTEINVCNWNEVKRTDCNIFTVYNHSGENAILNIYKVIAEQDTDLISTQNVQSLGTAEIKLEDGIYIFELLGFDEIVYNYIIPSYCSMFECFKMYIDKLICDKATSNCSPCLDENCNEKDYYNFNAFMSLYHVYFSGINEIYKIEGVIDFINDSNIKKLYHLDKIADIAKNYCKPCNTPCNDCN